MAINLCIVSVAKQDLSYFCMWAMVGNGEIEHKPLKPRIG